MDSGLQAYSWVNGEYSIRSEDDPSAKLIPIINPATEELIAKIEITSSEAVHDIVSKSLHAFKNGPWPRADSSERFAVLSKAAGMMRERMHDFIRYEAMQTGRPIREMRAQLARIPEWLEYFASLARTMEGRVTPFKGPVVNTLTRHPLGVVAQITPWNHPLLIATKKMAAALAAGNCVIVKPSELAPLSVLMMGKIFQAAGLPDGALQIITGTGPETGKYLCQDRRLAKIDLTGGLGTYRAIAPAASQNLISITAELGGKAPVCIFESMAVGRAVQAALFASFIASGQTCVTGSRILVHDKIYDEFTALLVERTKKLRIGDPTLDDTQIGAVINKAAVERCTKFVAEAVSEGGKLLCGGSPTTVTGKGFFFHPTLIETSATSSLSCNEVFGPVIAIIRCTSEDDMIDVANSTNYALGASVWTNDFAQAHRVAEKIEAGIVWINGHHLNDPSSPWGGFKESGVGKENGIEAYESYTKVKSTIINYGILPTWFDDDVGTSRYG
ncbi:hypothetical protein LTR05_008300 [Lithohypha guttulata]|uniref:aldehyde dehydrogenase (NAD(+)) n=1 Tax=Lithohypha guttulata TaxID=1690604 RepID=A0AAN7YCX5_9EURO|nr:hypothetical protein LTR05_008300 [Lithohypha guttulata]